ncbi:MAG: hypothetical protein ACP5JW_01285 [Candidatus Bathyarchaeia archaeon]
MQCKRLTWVKDVINPCSSHAHDLAEYPKTKLVILGKGEQQNDIIEAAVRLGISEKLICRFDFVPEKVRILIMRRQTSVFFLC